MAGLVARRWALAARSAVPSGARASAAVRHASSDRPEPNQCETLTQIGCRKIYDTDHDLCVESTGTRLPLCAGTAGPVCGHVHAS